MIDRMADAAGKLAAIRIERELFGARIGLIDDHARITGVGRCNQHVIRRVGGRSARDEHAAIVGRDRHQRALLQRLECQRLMAIAAWLHLGRALLAPAEPVPEHGVNLDLFSAA